MDEMIQEAVLSSIEDIEEQQLFAEYEVLMAIADVYTKSALIQESTGLVFDGEAIVQEADDASSEKSDSKLKATFKKFAGSTEKGAESGVAGFFAKVIRFIKKAFSILLKKIAHFLRVLKNKKSDQLLTFTVDIDVAVRASESLAEAAPLLKEIFSAKLSDTTAIKKATTFIRSSEKTLGKVYRSYKETASECEAQLKALKENLGVCNDAIKDAKEDAKQYGEMIANDAYKDKSDQIMSDKQKTFNTDFQALTSTFSNVLAKLTKVSGDIASTLGVKKTADGEAKEMVDAIARTNGNIPE